MHSGGLMEKDFTMQSLEFCCRMEVDGKESSVI